MTSILTTLFIAFLALGLFFLLPIRNTIRHEKRPWATWLLIAANLGVWVLLSLKGRGDIRFDATGLAERLTFAGDFARPWTLVTAQFFNLSPAVLFVSVWLLYIIGPALEERLTGPGLLACHIGGGAAAMALYGLLARQLGGPVFAAGMAPGLLTLSGVYLILYPYEEIVLAYNLLFFAFFGIFLAPGWLLVIVALAFQTAAASLPGPVMLEIELPAAGLLALAKLTLPVVGWSLGLLAGAILFGFGAFAGRGLRPKRPQAKVLPVEEEEELRDPETRDILGREASPERIEAFAQQAIRTERGEQLEDAWREFRRRFPDKMIRPGVLATMAKRFAQNNRPGLAVEAYRALLEHHPETPVAHEGRFHLAQLLSRDPQSAVEAIDLLESFLSGQPAYDLANEARRLLAQLTNATGGDTYAGLSENKPFRFREPAPAAIEPPAEPAGEEAAAPVALEEPVAVLPPPAPEIVPESHSQTLSSWGRKDPEPVDVTTAMEATSAFAVILLPNRTPLGREAVATLATFWQISQDQAAERLRVCRGILLDDAPVGRAKVLSRKLRSLGLPVAIVPLLPDIAYGDIEDVLEFEWNDSQSGNITVIGRRIFDWSDLRMANIGRVGLPGAGAAYRTVLDLFVGRPHVQLRFWESMLSFNRSVLAGRAGAVDSLAPLVEYIDIWAQGALKTPSFAGMAKKTAAPLDFHSPTELDHYNHWFLYAAFGRYRAEE